MNCPDCLSNKRVLCVSLGYQHVGYNTISRRSLFSQTAQQLWDSLPGVYRQCAVSDTDFWDAYSSVFPKTRHGAVGKESGQTNHIERFNCTLRQRISRLTRKTLSFSKKRSNHMGAIWYFIHHYNASLLI